MAHAHWEREGEVLVHNSVPISKFVSRKTGLRVALVQHQGPLVNLFCTLATEAHDDDGCPHTLEHLIFLGSEDYPYKGTLDQLANLAMAQGTNAWTATDHTAYTVSTAGVNGFLQLLPIYMDHILYPTITDAGCVTEVYHVTGDGRDAGVVYCEMEAIEHQATSMAMYTLGQMMYPGKSGYKSETGGRLSNLRTLSVDTIRKYHRDYYRPDNMLVLVSGNIAPEQIFEALAGTEAKILKKGPLPPIQRPWFVDMHHEFPPVSRTAEVAFPADDAGCGTVVIGWRAPDRWCDVADHAALHILLTYLTDSSVSPMRKAFVDTPETNVCSEISFSTETTNASSYHIEFEQTVVDKQNTIIPRLFEEVLNERHHFDLDRIRDVANAERLRALADAEDNPSEFYAHIVIDDFVYGERGSSRDLKELLTLTDRYLDLANKPETFWKSLMHKYFIDRPYCAVIGTPSAPAAKALEQESHARVDERRNQLGETGLAEKAALLQRSIQANEIPVPDSVLHAFRIGDPSDISLFSVDRRYGKEASFYEIPSAFTSLRAYLNTDHLSEKERLYIDLLTEIMFELPMRNPATGALESVVNQLNADLISREASVCHRFPQLMLLTIRAELSKYPQAVRWLHYALFEQVFTPDRLKVGALKLKQQLSHVKHKGDQLVRHIVINHSFRERSNLHASNICVQIPFVKTLLARLDSEPDAVSREITDIARKLASTVVVHVVGGPVDLDEAVLRKSEIHKQAAAAAAACNIPAAVPPTGPAAHIVEKSFALRRHNASHSTLIATSGVGSSGYLNASIDGPTSFDDPEFLPILVAIEALCGLESYFWKEIRGKGYSYNYGIRLIVEQGMLSFRLNRSTNLGKAFDVARNIVEHIIKQTSTTVTLNPLTLLLAKSQVIFGLISEEDTYYSAASEASMREGAQFGDKDLMRRLLAGLKHVTLEQCRAVIEKYFHPLLFAPPVLVMAVGPEKAPAVLSTVNGMGFSIASATLKDEIPGDEDDDDDDVEMGEDDDGEDDGEEMDEDDEDGYEDGVEGHSK